ncbi:hypothetical protein EIP91_001303 [Steccherinum ochraceum]|uniref:Uncharacterized protein n=1 Tax=Steccherinum ochraceum TaxID=92696 RepID=A0A4R0RRL9_9APHY|nr:hypothetical protein EIP91_001303 [Steccherinum ochraceum]
MQQPLQPPQPSLVPTHYFPPAPRKPPLNLAEWPIPSFRLRCEELEHPGAKLFFEHVNPVELLREAVLAVFTWLYTEETVPRQVETVVLVLRAFDGAAHATGADVYKEIHFNLDHIANSASRVKDEVFGVLVHEMTHCYQYNGLGTCPGGLVEGVADWVRLHAGYRPPHWREGGGDKWDAGYADTAFFLVWVEARYGYGIVRNLNLAMRGRRYDDVMFKEQTGRKVASLWKEYRAYVESQGQGQKEAKS